MANRIRNMEPRMEFYDFDLLFKGYALFFLDYDLSARTFKKVLDRNPTWGIARSYRAITVALNAENKDRVEDVVHDLDVAREEIEIAQSLVLEENAWILLVRLFVEYKTYDLYRKHGLSSEDMEKARGNAFELAERIRREYPDYISGRWVAALFYRDAGELQKADEVWDGLLSDGSDLYAFSAIGYHYTRNTSEETINRIENLDMNDPMVLAAKAFVLADMPEGRGEALEICGSLLKNARSNWTRLVALQIYLLCGEFERARDEAAKWLKIAASTRAVPGEERAIEVIASHDGASIQLDNECQLPRFFQEYALGLVALAHGERDKARQYFETCVQMDVTASNTWAEAFLEHLKSEPKWPRCNPHIQAETVVDSVIDETK